MNLNLETDTQFSYWKTSKYIWNNFKYVNLFFHLYILWFKYRLAFSMKIKYSYWCSGIVTIQQILKI